MQRSVEIFVDGLVHAGVSWRANLGSLEDKDIAGIVCSINKPELCRVVGTYVCYLWGPEFDAWTSSLSSRPMFFRYFD
jgi:hypothetical protein